jgi:hypothetical protein
MCNVRLESNRHAAMPCPHLGVYKSLTMHSTLSLPLSTCVHDGIGTLSIGCEQMNDSELTLSTSCRHDRLPDVQVITSIQGQCLASWRTDHRFQRTLVMYDTAKAFCLVNLLLFVFQSVQTRMNFYSLSKIQPLKSSIASWIVSDLSCTHIDHTAIRMENSLGYYQQCDDNNRFRLISLNRSSLLSLYSFEFYFIFFSIGIVRSFVNMIMEQ